MKRAVLVLLLAAGCTREAPLGAACEDATDCGRGAGCYRGVCTPMCATDAECADTFLCARHFCLTATGEPGRARHIVQAPGVKPANDPPSSPTPTAAEALQPPITGERLPSGAPPTNHPTAPRSPPTAKEDPRLPPVFTREPSPHGGFDPIRELYRLRAEVDELRARQERLEKQLEAASGAKK